MQIRRTAAVLTAAAALSLSGVAVAAPANAALINANVVLIDVLSDNQVIAQVPVGVAAALCGVNAAVLLAEAEQGDSECTATNTSRARGQQR